MIKLYIDSDIILDLLLKRNDYYNNAAELMTKIDKKKFKGYTTPLVIANIHYIMTKFGGKKKSIENIRKLRKIISILSIDEEIVDEALLSDNKDLHNPEQNCHHSVLKLPLFRAKVATIPEINCHFLGISRNL
jgi:predicted nucleic acid-binding protein